MAAREGAAPVFFLWDARGFIALERIFYRFSDKVGLTISVNTITNVPGNKGDPMISFKQALSLGVMSIGLAGCATVINGTSQDYKISSNPAGAKVHTTGGSECVTPCELNLKRRHDFRADITREGYKPAYVLVQSRTGGAMVGNILMGGLIGGVVDGSNGASNHLYPQPLNVKLAAEGSDDEAVLLDKNGKQLGTVAAHNTLVRADVARTIGKEAAGPADVAAVTPAAVAEPQPAPTAAVSPESSAPQGDAPASATPADTAPVAAAPAPASAGPMAADAK